jgi:hypothetical protein
MCDMTLTCDMNCLKETPMQSERDQKAAPASSRRLSASGYARALMPSQFLIANLELEFNLNIHESITYNFLIANKTRFCDAKIFALPRAFSSFEPRASSL